VKEGRQQTANNLLNLIAGMISPAILPHFGCGQNLNIIVMRKERDERKAGEMKR
jgi:hypothetical protein